MIGADFHHRDFVLLLQAKECERHPDIVVVVSAGTQDRVRRGKHRGNHVFRCGLAVASADGDDGNIEPVTIQPGEHTECPDAVLHHEERACGDGGRFRSRFHDSGARATGEGLGKVAVAVEVFTAERDEEVARLQRARVGGNAGEGPSLRRAGIAKLDVRNLREIVAGKIHRFVPGYRSTSSRSSKWSAVSLIT
jgi:hypothetical protein